MAEEIKLKHAVIEFVKILMNKLEQNRVVILLFPEEAIMLEKTVDLDPNINL